MKKKSTRPERAEHAERVIPKNITYPMTDFEDPGDEQTGPSVSDENVWRTKKFVDENHK